MSIHPYTSANFSLILTKLSRIAGVMSEKVLNYQEI